MPSQFSLPIPSPPTLGPKHPPRPLSKVTTIGGGLPPLNHGRAAATPTIGARQHRLCLSSYPAPCSAETSHRPRTLHSHLLPTNTPALHSHLYFGCKLPVRHVPLGLASVATKDRATLHIHSRLGKVYKRALVVPPSSPHQRAFVCWACTGTAQVGVSLVSLFDPLFKRSRLHCLDVCLT